MDPTTLSQYCLYKLILSNEFFPVHSTVFTTSVRTVVLLYKLHTFPNYEFCGSVAGRKWNFFKFNFEREGTKVLMVLHVSVICDTCNKYVVTCNQHAIHMWSTCNQHEINMQSTCNQHVINMKSTRNQHAINMQRLWSVVRCTWILYKYLAVRQSEWDTVLHTSMYYTIYHDHLGLIFLAIFLFIFSGQQFWDGDIWGGGQ